MTLCGFDCVFRFSTHHLLIRDKMCRFRECDTVKKMKIEPGRDSHTRNDVKQEPSWFNLALTVYFVYRLHTRSNGRASAHHREERALDVVATASLLQKSID